MVRLFSLLSVIAVLMIITTGAGVYWLSAEQIIKAKQDSAETIAKSVASAISAQINLLTDILEKMAQDPDVLTAVTRVDTTDTYTIAEKLEKHLPGILKIRLLLPGTSELDNKSLPKMGYADLDMVRETLVKNQLPAIQGDSLKAALNQKGLRQLSSVTTGFHSRKYSCAMSSLLHNCARPSPFCQTNWLSIALISKS